ncbi:MAG: hypothetical protein K0M60_15895 [Hydrogenophaga sp.]|nr:hypothetical protein [Hydrogenophaga sp.]
MIRQFATRPKEAERNGSCDPFPHTRQACRIDRRPNGGATDREGAVRW